MSKLRNQDRTLDTLKQLDPELADVFRKAIGSREKKKKIKNIVIRKEKYQEKRNGR